MGALCLKAYAMKSLSKIVYFLMSRHSKCMNKSTRKPADFRKGRGEIEIVYFSLR